MTAERKELTSFIVKPLAKMFNKSLQHAHFSSGWKYTNVTPIHKKDDIYLPYEYRPVTLLSQIGISIEKCVHIFFFFYLFIFF